MSRQGTWFALLLASAISAACRGELVGPADGGPDTADDGLAPRIFGLAPSALVQVLNDTEVWFHVEDPPSADGTPGSGVDIGSVQVRVQGGASLPITQQGPTFHASIASLPEGPTVLDVSVRDRAGNEATTQFDFVLDRTPPVATLVASPQAVTSTEWSTTIGLAGSVADQNGLSSSGLFSAVTYTIVRPGANGECFPFGPPFEIGTTRGKVEQSRHALSPTEFDVRATVINGTTGPDDAPRTMRYCGVLRAVDTARNAAGAPAGNVLYEVFTHDVTWQPFPFPSATDLAGRWAVTYSQSAFACLRPYLNGYGSADAPFFAVEGVGDQALLQVTLPDGWGPISGAYERIRGQFTGHIEEVVLPDDWYAQYRTWRVLPTESWHVAFDGPANAPFFVGQAHVEWAYDMAEYFDLDEGWTVPAHSVECSTEVSVFGEKLP
jgi:hypothetical protein